MHKEFVVENGGSNIASDILSQAAERHPFGPTGRRKKPYCTQKDEDPTSLGAAKEGREMEILGGCYEQILFGFAVDPAENWAIVPDFTHHAHSASLSAVAVNERYVVTGSRDETIQIYDMKNKVEHGTLVHHNGTITCLEFYGSAHLLSGAEDGLICIWNTKKWECLKTIKAHKGQVTSLSIHPSGKLALSVGTDRTLRTWNLVEGRSAFIKNIKQNAHLVKWSPNGEIYVVAGANKVDIYKLETASLSGTIVTEKRISSVKFITESLLAVAGDEEVIRLFDCESHKCLCEFKAHENRIKALYTFKMEGLHILATASSDGYIKIWNLDIDKINNAPPLLCEVETKARLTCLAVWLKNDFGPRQISSEAMSSSQVHEADQPSVKRKNVCCIDSNNSSEGDGCEIPVKRKSRNIQRKKKMLQRLK